MKMYNRKLKKLEPLEPLETLFQEGAYGYPFTITLYPGYFVRGGFEWTSYNAGGAVTRTWRITQEEEEKIRHIMTLEQDQFGDPLSAAGAWEIIEAYFLEQLC